ncbi:MAG: hypothetical protein PVH31_01650, partial [Ectothiorhodospiraceae bacterium]
MTRNALREIYEGEGAGARRTRWVLMAFDLAVVCFFVVTTFVHHAPWIVVVDYALGVFYLLDYLARWWAARDRTAYV